MMEHWNQGFANWLPKFVGIIFFCIGAMTRPQSSAFITSLGQIENVFSISALTPSVKPLVPISTFDRNA
jgi:hypothetical protein